jgi:orotate phosphoribosyltransferase
MGRTLGVRALFAERQDGKLVLRRGFTLGPADRLLVVEDVVTTGLSTRETIAVARAHGAAVMAAAALVDRSGGRASLDVPLTTLLRMDLPAWPPDECPLCAQGVPLAKPGSR